MKKQAFSSEQYLNLQRDHILERINQFDGKLYLEFGVGGDGAGGMRTPASSGSLMDSRVPVNQTDGSREERK